MTRCPRPNCPPSCRQGRACPGRNPPEAAAALVVLALLAAVLIVAALMEILYG
jgi:hypothetical protein